MLQERDSSLEHYAIAKHMLIQVLTHNNSWIIHFKIIIVSTYKCLVWLKSS